MNKYDSELVAGILIGNGYRLTGIREEADIILINTCGVREHAENRALSDVDRMLSWKRHGTVRVVGMIGCLSCLIGDEVIKRCPELDFVIGPDTYRRLPELLAAALVGKSDASILVESNSDETYGDLVPSREPGVRAWLAVSRGCDNFCSYCMVPLARGMVRNRPVNEIIREVETLVAEGYSEVVLLGQNVNAYTSDDTGFGGLLRRVAEVPGLKRVRFMTSHPKDLDDDLILALSEGGVICPDLHLPVQSGSDRILEAMNRGYTRTKYLKLVDKLRERIPEIALSTDAIVGFPGETQDDFNQTVSLFEEVGYASGFVFRYSPRPGTAAMKWNDNIPDEIKTQRLMRLNETLSASRHKLQTSCVGKTLEVMIEGQARKHPDQVTGRSRQGFIVALPTGDLQPGDIITTLIEGISGFTLLST